MAVFYEGDSIRTGISMGDIVQDNDNSQYYMISRTGRISYNLISLDSGNRYTERKLNLEELKSIIETKIPDHTIIRKDIDYKDIFIR